MDLSQPRNPPHLPQELVDNIVDHLYNDPLALSSCSRVCKAWLPTSRLHLYSKISLKATSPHNGPALPQQRCEKLHALLVKSPHLICNIKELQICEGSPLHHHYPDVQNSTTWVTTERTLTTLFRMLTHVKRFDFSASSFIFWTLLPPTFQAALFDLLSLPTLIYVRLHSWVFPDLAAFTTLLSHCQNLRALSLSSTTINLADGNTLLGHAVNNVALDLHATRPPLEVLTLDFVTFPLLQQWISGQDSLADITSLRELRVAHFQDPSIVDTLLTAVGASLEHFHLKPGVWNVYEFNLANNSGLRSLRITLDVPETAMEWTRTILSTFTEDNAFLESITLEFYADPKRITGWNDLDALFMQPQFAGLKHLEVGLFAIPTHADFIKVKEEMGGVGSRDIVRWYQLGIKKERSSRHLRTRISFYESSD